MENSLVNHFKYLKEAGKSSQYCDWATGLDGSEYESHQSNRYVSPPNPVDKLWRPCSFLVRG